MGDKEMNIETVKQLSDSDLGFEIAKMCEFKRVYSTFYRSPEFYQSKYWSICTSLDNVAEIQNIVIKKLRDAGVVAAEMRLHDKLQEAVDGNWLMVYRASARHRAEACYLTLIALKEKESK